MTPTAGSSCLANYQGEKENISHFSHFLDLQESYFHKWAEAFSHKGPAGERRYGGASGLIEKQTMTRFQALTVEGVGHQPSLGPPTALSRLQRPG